MFFLHMLLISDSQDQCQLPNAKPLMALLNHKKCWCSYAESGNSRKAKSNKHFWYKKFLQYLRNQHSALHQKRAKNFYQVFFLPKWQKFHANYFYHLVTRIKNCLLHILRNFFPLKKCFLNSSETSLNVFGFENLFEKVDLCCNEGLWRASPEFHNHHHQSDFEILFCSCQSVAASRENAAEAEALLRNLSDWTFALQPCTLTCKIILGKNFVHKIIDYLKVVVVFVKKISHGLIITQHVTIYGLISH